MDDSEPEILQEINFGKAMDSVILPSTVTDRNEIYFPNGISKDDPRIYGKWIIETHGNLKLQNHLWIQLQNLIKNKEVILLGSSIIERPTQNSFKTIIKCYTGKNLNLIKNCGVKISRIQKDPNDLKYEANDFQDGPGKVIKYVLSIDRKFFRKEKGCKYTEVTDAELEPCTFEKKIIANSENPNTESPDAKRKRLESTDKCYGSCPFEFGASTCKCVEEYIKKECEKEVDVVLPATVTDKEEIQFPEYITYDDPSVYGKWLIFTNGNLSLQNHLWIQLQSLIDTGELILLISSTAKSSQKEKYRLYQGVLKCYTSRDINIIRQAGLAIKNILKDDTILDYKTNTASWDNHFRASGVRFITKFMLTVNGKLYHRDTLCRWIQVTDDEYVNYVFEENSPQKISAPISLFDQRKLPESDSLPSQETRKKIKTYVYPDGACINESSGLWCLNCSIAAADDAGYTELDHAWKEAKALQEENYFEIVSCQTKAFKTMAKPVLQRRTIMFKVYDNELVDVQQIIIKADKIREKISYNMPMHFKMMMYKNKKPELILKYMYTEDGELYEYTDAKWKLFKTV